MTTMNYNQGLPQENDMFNFVCSNNVSKVKGYVETFLDMVFEEIWAKYDVEWDFAFGSANKMIPCKIDRNKYYYNLLFDITITPRQNDYNLNDLMGFIKQAFRRNRYEFSIGFNEYEDYFVVTNSRGFGTVKFAINIYVVDNSEEHSPFYVRCYKSNYQMKYGWKYNKVVFACIKDKINWLKENNLWNKFRDNCLEDFNKYSYDSGSIFAESLHEFCAEKGYFKPKKEKKPTTQKTPAKPESKFIYVGKNKAKPVKDKLIKLINLVKNEVKDIITLKEEFVGSASRDMITYNPRENTGFDLDVDLIVEKCKKGLSAKEINDIIKGAIDKHCGKSSFSYAEDSTCVLTIKNIDKKNSKINYSCDFAIVKYNKNNQKLFLKNNKGNSSNPYIWNERGGMYKKLYHKFSLIQSNSEYFKDLKNIYLRKKNTNTNADKHSIFLFAEAVNEICSKHKITAD